MNKKLIILSVAQAASYVICDDNHIFETAIQRLEKRIEIARVDCGNSENCKTFMNDFLDLVRKSKMKEVGVDGQMQYNDTIAAFFALPEYDQKKIAQFLETSLDVILTLVGSYVASEKSFESYKDSMEKIQTNRSKEHWDFLIKTSLSSKDI